MKLIIKSTPCLPAYSLKAFNSSSTTAKSRNKQFSRVIRHRRSSTGNSYLKTTSINKITIPTPVQPGDKNWFISYE